ncbi:MAG: 3-methyl-2-oxobutanoate hydroxymethyltransferase [Acidobacteriota bacterium]|nr:3-methyl-2-oxobutanoate hydroxymethyltransferase [Blastocatellia bacterium]MDW8412452.1 3-methyl-2-oxobutanoate hydroxymethyltransferase [Acidobacteriota bacterium]
MSHLGSAEGKVTTRLIRESKGKKIVAITAYDYPSARLVDEAGVDIVLVGDSAANVVFGYDNTLPVTLDEMLLLARGVTRAVKRALVVGDMPFGTYHSGRKQALRSAVRFLKEGGVEAVKLEGGARRASLVEELCEAGIPVMGHIGLTPQSLHQMGGYRVQGRTAAAAHKLIEDALALQQAGAFSIVLEGMPAEIAGMITERVSIPTIGIGAGSKCDGQILVYHDLLGLSFGHQPKFVRRYVQLRDIISKALTAYVDDVRSGRFPSEEESYHLSAEVREQLEK